MSNYLRLKTLFVINHPIYELKTYDSINQMIDSSIIIITLFRKDKLLRTGINLTLKSFSKYLNTKIFPT
jgi:hypothetical protein